MRVTVVCPPSASLRWVRRNFVPYGKNTDGRSTQAKALVDNVGTPSSLTLSTGK